MNQTVLNIELLKKCDISMQKNPTHPFLHVVTKIKDPPTLLRDVIFEWPLQMNKSLQELNKEENKHKVS